MCNDEKPVIEIYANSGGLPKYSVRVNGKEIENLRSFSIRVSNEWNGGIKEALFYQAEQYVSVSPRQDRRGSTAPQAAG